MLYVYRGSDVLADELAYVLRIFESPEAVHRVDAGQLLKDALGACTEASDALGVSVTEDAEGVWVSVVKAGADHSAQGADVRIPTAEASDRAHMKRLVKRALYTELQKWRRPRSPWGILLGIRPTKIVHELMDRGASGPEIRKCLQAEYCIDADRVDLLMEVAQRERPYVYPLDTRAVSLYVCIPFCPTRCAYCSFPSNDAVKKKRLIDPYVDALCLEISDAIERVRVRGEYIDCVYVGGGTPTTLNATQLDTVLNCIVQGLAPEWQLREFTVEAGRPDTIDFERLQVMKAHGVTRVCVNPQTMHSETLTAIGRAHTPDAIASAMAMVREVGFSTVNMDVILGLPGETVAHTRRTLEAIMSYAPENITVHTLAVKRASKINANPTAYMLSEDAVVQDMIEDSAERLKLGGWHPYYLYRQKNMVGQLENVGYTREGRASLYNIRIMEERHTILACGAGAVSKVCFPEENRFERIANFKDVETYLDRFDEILARKALYTQFNKPR